MKTMLENAKAAKAQVCNLTSEEKNAALLAMAEALTAHVLRFLGHCGQKRLPLWGSCRAKRD